MAAAKKISQRHKDSIKIPAVFIKTASHAHVIPPRVAHGTPPHLTVNSTQCAAVIFRECGDDGLVEWRKMWISVINQARIDLYSNWKRKSAEKDRREAEAWIFIPNPDFEQVCNFAGLAPEYVRRLAMREKQRMEKAA